MSPPAPLAGRLLVLAGAYALLTGCAHRVGDVDDGLNYAERQARLAAIPDWALGGRLGIRTPEENRSANVDWLQSGERLQLEVRGFLGAGSFDVAGDPDNLTIERRGETRVLADPELDLSREFGWWLPVTSLEYWLLGRPDDRFPRRMDRGPAGTLAELEQRDWHIVYEEYQLAGGLLVPRIIKLTHQTLELTLSIRDWELPGAQA